MAVRGSVRWVENRKNDQAHRDVGRMTGEGAAGAIDALRGRDMRQSTRQVVVGMTEAARRRPAIVLGVAVTIGLVVLAARLRSARRMAATPAPSASRGDDATPTMPVDAAGVTDVGSPLVPAPSSAPDAPALAPDAEASAATGPDAPPSAPASDDDAPVRVTGADGHIAPVIVAGSPLSSTPWPQTPTTPAGGPTT